MTILTTKQTWRRAPGPTGHKSRRESALLTPAEEQAGPARHVAMWWVLQLRFGN